MLAVEEEGCFSRRGGTLAVTSSRILWLENSQISYAWPAKCITMHAISREGSGAEFQDPAIVCQFEENPPDEAYFAPQDPDTLSECFRAFSQVSN